MAIDVLSFLGVIAVTVILGYVANYIFERTKVADIVWLLMFGFAVTWFGLLPQAPFISLSPLLGTIAILIILFDAGLNMDFYQFVKGVGRGFALGILGLLFSIVAVGLLGFFVFGFGLMQSILLGAMLGGITSAIVLGISKILRMAKNAHITLSLESIITDPLTIITSLAIMSLIVVPATGSIPPIQSIAAAFSVGGVVGLLIGIIWLGVLDKIKGKPFHYILTVGMAFGIYVLAEVAGGSGAIAALFFGLALGNGRTFSKILKFKKVYTISPVLKRFQGEITFFIRAFFFVWLGLIVVINPTYAVYGLILAVVLIIIRLPTVWLGTAGMGLYPHDKHIMQAMVPRGLAPAVLAQIALSQGVPGAEAFSSIIFVVILATVIYTAISTVLLTRHKHPKEEKAFAKHKRHRKKKK